MSMDARDADGAVLLVVQLWAAQPAAKKASKFVARRVFVIRVQFPNRSEARIASHVIEEIIDEFEYSGLTAGSPIRAVCNAVVIFVVRIHSATLRENTSICIAASAADIGILRA